MIGALLNCDCKEIRCSKLDKFVIEKFNQYFFNDDNIKIITEKINILINENAQADKEYREAKNNLKTLKISRDNLIEAIVQTGSNQTIVDKIKDYEDKIAKTESFINDYENRELNVVITENDVKKQINKLKEYMNNPDNLITTKYVLSQYIERIDVSNENISVEFKITLPPDNGGNSFCSVILHTDFIRRKKLINFEAENHCSNKE